MKKKRQQKKPERTSDGMRTEYDFRGGIRGKYAARFRGMVRAVVLDADVAEAFPTTIAVNEALRKLAKEVNKKKRAAK